VTHAELRLDRGPVEVWLSFACTPHRDQLIAPRELLDRDRAVLATGSSGNTERSTARSGTRRSRSPSARPRESWRAEHRGSGEGVRGHGRQD
jgi:hypothetical protein